MEWQPIESAPTHWMEMPHHPKWPKDGWQARNEAPNVEGKAAPLRGVEP